jgi:hypothetical protein
VIEVRPQEEPENDRPGAPELAGEPDAGSPEEDALFAKVLARELDDVQVWAFIERWFRDPDFRERGKSFTFCRTFFNPLFRRVLVPWDLTCRDVRRRFAGDPFSGGVAPLNDADRRHTEVCGSCSLAWVVFREIGRQLDTDGAN